MRAVLSNTGFILQITGVFLIVPLVASIVLGERSSMVLLSITTVFFLALGFMLNSLSEKKELDYKGACIFVLLSFIMLGFIGSIPFLNMLSPVDSVFESVSGFTTTGYTMVQNFEALDQSILLYRGLIQFLGGLIIVLVFVLFFSPKYHKFKLEKALGLKEAKNVFKKTFLKILGIYVGLTVILILLSLPRYNIIESASYVFAGISTGGIPPMPVGGWMHIIIFISMILGATNFLVFYKMISEKLKKVLFSEFTYLILIIIVFSVAGLFLGLNLQDSLFHVASASTTTGYDYAGIGNQPLHFIYMVIFLMFIGGSSFSTAGGLKIIRLLALLKAVPIVVYNKIKGTEKRVILWGNILKKEDLIFMVKLMIFMVLAISVSAVMFMDYGYTATESIFESTSALTTTGYNTGITNALMPFPLKFILALLMIIGRIEVIPFVIVVKNLMEGG